MSLWEVQLAVMTLLEQEPGLPPVFDLVPKDAPYPRGTMGAPTLNRQGQFAGRRSRSILIVDWWGLAEEVVGTRRIIYGSRQVMEIAALAREVLDGYKVGNIRRLRWEMDMLIPDPNPNIRHVQQRYAAGVVG